MRKLSKLGKWTVGGIFVLAASAGLTFGIISWDSNNAKQQAEAKQPDTVVIESFNEVVEVPKYEDFSDYELQKEVHGMTHQKVEASEKWYYSQITVNKVEALYEEIKNRNFEDPELKLILLQIEPWLEGDFTNVVSVHNQIWEYNNGTIGKASGYLSPEEEKEFIIEHYK